MTTHKVVSHSAWRQARIAFLAKEKEFTRLRDQLSQARRDLPWERVDKEYVFQGEGGMETLAQLFEGRSQLIVYHFMLGPDWEVGCKSCSFWADNFDGIPIHLKHRDTAFAAVSRAPWPKIEAYRRRMGWRFKWVSSHGSDFNFDYDVSSTPEQLAQGPAPYNYGSTPSKSDERPGVSVFIRDGDGALFHTYSTYSRGLDMLNGAYHFLDLTPKGRDEAGLPFPMTWVRHHDRYEG